MGYGHGFDAVRGVARVARVAIALGIDRLRKSSALDLPFDASALSAEWLSQALSQHTPGVRVTSFEVLDDHSGTTSRARLALAYADRGEGALLPDRMFLKIAPAAAAQRVFATLFGLGRNETDFYRSTWGELPVRVPEVYAAECSAGGRRFALLLEDLDPETTRFATVGDRVELEQATQVIDQLAKLHAAFWESPRFRSDLAWLPTLASRRNDLPLNRFITGAMVRRAVKQYAAELPPEFGKIAELVIDRREGLEALWARGPQTLVHGDCHVGNLFFQEQGVGFLDWQVCAQLPGIRDVSYFLTNSCPSKLRREHEGALIERYLEGLRSAGVAPPSFDESWRDHRIHVAYTWLSSAVTAAAGEGFQSRRVALAGLERSTRAVIEIDTLGVLAQELN